MDEITDPRALAAMALANRAPGSYASGIPQLAPLAPPTAADAEAAQQRALVAQQPIPQATHAVPPVTIADMVRKQEAEAAAAVPPGPRTLADAGGQRQGPPILAPRYAPAGWIPGTKNEQREYGLNPEEVDPAVKLYESSATHARNAADAELQAAQMKARNDAYYAAEKMKAEQQYAQEKAAQDTKRKLYVDETMADLAKRSDAVANAKVNPEQFWEGHGGALGSVLAAIAVGMGQYSASRTGGPNAALGIINGAIDRNIAAQRDNIESQRAGLQAKNSLYAQNLAAFGDKEAALLATKVNYLEQAKAFADQQAALNEGSARAMAQAERFNAATDNQIGDLKLKIANLTHDRLATSSSQHYSPGGLIGGAAAPKEDDRLIQMSNGDVYRGRSEPEANKGRKLNAAYENMKNILDEASKIRKQTGLHEYAGKAIGYDSENIAKLQSLSAQATFAMKDLEDAGALDKGVSDQAGKLVGDFASLTGNPEARGNAYLDTILKKRDAFMRSQIPLVRQLGITETGKGDYAQTSIGLPKINKGFRDIKTNKIGSK